MLLVLFFAVLLALKLFAIALVYTTPPIVPLAAIGALIFISYRVDAIAAKPARPAPRSPEYD